VAPAKTELNKQLPYHSTPVPETRSPFMRSTAAALTLAAGLLLAPVLTPLAAAADTAAPAVTVYKSPTCGCCVEWATHLRDNGFAVTEKDTEELYTLKALAGVPDEVASCHTATVGGYVIEGHVPAGDIHRLLSEQPKALGLAVPGMPPSSPGMDVPGYENTPFETLLVDHDGSTEVWEQH
jgi:hypothetical protein